MEKTIPLRKNNTSLLPQYNTESCEKTTTPKRLTIAQNQTIIGSMMNEETKMIDYVAAEDGCIEFYAGLGNLVVKSNDIEVLTAPCQLL